MANTVRFVDIGEIADHRCSNSFYNANRPVCVNKGNNKITELRTILQRESPNS